MTPPPISLIPAASSFATAALISTGAAVIGRWTSFSVMVRTSIARHMSIAWSRLNLRSEYEARPTFSRRGRGDAGASRASKDAAAAPAPGAQNAPRDVGALGVRIHKAAL